VQRSLGRWTAAALAALTMCAAQAQETLKVGVLVSYSGISAMTGQATDKVIKMFQDKYGTEVGGRKIEFVRRDSTGPNPEVVRRLAQELIVREKVQVMIGPDFTPNVLAVAPLVTEAKVPTILPGAATQGIVGEKSPYYMRTFFSVPQVVRPMAQWAAKNGIKKVSVVVADYGPGQDAEATFAKTFTELGGSIVTTIKVPVRNPEFSGYMQRLKDSNADAAFVFMPMGELALQFLKSYSDAGLKDSKMKLLSTVDLTDETTLEAAGAAALGAITAGSYSAAHDSALNREFAAAYEKAVGKTPRMSMYHVVIWDSMHVIYSALEKQRGAKFNPDKFMADARSMAFESPRGPISFDKQTGDITQNTYIRRVERVNGVLQNIEFDTIANVPAK
jgi:branched-chain amino acid transport system substrate-binding protein